MTVEPQMTDRQQIGDQQQNDVHQRSQISSTSRNVGSDQSCFKFPRILVSAREISEIAPIISVGVDVIDLKEPRRGALAAADPRLWRQVADRFIDHQTDHSPRWPDHSPLWSVALGEIDDAMGIARECPPAFDYAKAGPRGCGDIDGLVAAWRQIKDRLPGGVALVAVAYADWQNATTPPPMQILVAAQSLGLETILIDTWSKTHGDSIEHLGRGEIQNLTRTAHRHKMQCFIAGGMSVDRAFSLFDPDPGKNDGLGFGFRGAMCGGNRLDRLCPRLVEQAVQRRDQTVGP